MIRKSSLITIIVALLIVIGGYLYTQSRETRVEVKIVADTTTPPKRKLSAKRQSTPSRVVETVAEPRNAEEGVEIVYVDHPDNVRAAKEAEEAGATVDAINKAADEQLNSMLEALDRMDVKASAILADSKAFIKEQGPRQNSLPAQYLRDKYGGHPLTEQEMSDEMNNPEFVRLLKADVDKEIDYLIEGR